MIKVIDLKKVYTPKKGVPVTALNGINLDFSDKGLVFLLGKSGSGKSTLLNLIGGLDKYTDGDIIIKGKSTKDFTQSNFDSYRNTFVGFIFQEFNILEEYSVGKNIGLALELQHRPADKVAIEELLGKVDLEGYFDRKPNELSGGQKQRIAIARALIKNPDIIMADEPTGALDSITGRQVFDTLKKLSEYKLVIVVSHDRENAELYADRIIELADGNVISDRIRSQETNVLAPQPILVVDEKLIRIKAGTVLTESDAVAINAALSKSTDDVYISFDGSSNTEFSRKTSMLSGGQATFAETEAENIKSIEYDPAQFSLTKSRLPIKDCFKMGASSLTHKKFRLTMSIFLSFLTFAMVGFCVSASLFNFMKVEFQTAVDSNLPYIAIGSELNSTFGYLSATYGTVPLTNEQIKELERLTNSEALYFYEGNDYQNRYQNNLFFDPNVKTVPTMETQSLYDAVVITNYLIINTLEDIALTPIGSSKLPTKSNEIAITDYTADFFMKYGYSYGRGKDKVTVDITTPEELIGKKLTYQSGYEVIISGVFKTPMNKEEYASYKDVKATGGFVDMSFSPNETLMGMAFVGPNFTIPSGKNSGEYNVKLGLLHFSSAISDRSYSTYGVLTGNENLKYPEGSEQSGELESGQIALGNGALSDLFNLNNVGDFFDLTKEERTVTLTYVNAMEPIKLEVVALTNSEQCAIYAGTLAKIRTLDDYYLDFMGTMLSPNKYIGNNDNSMLCPVSLSGLGSVGQLSKAFSEHIYWGKTGTTDNPPKTTFADDEIVIPWTALSVFAGNINDAQNDPNFFDKVKIAFDSLTNREIYFSDTFSEDSKENYQIVGGKKMKIVGVHSLTSNGVYASENVFAQERAARFGERKVLVKMPKSHAEQQELLKYVMSQQLKSKTNDGQNILRFGTQSYSIIGQAQSLIAGLVLVFQYASIAFCIFAALLMMNFLTTSISYKKKEIGVLRAIGARSSDVFKIFFAESSIIVLINIVLASVLLGIGCTAINSVLKMSVLVFSPLPYLAMLGLGLLVAFVSTFIPTQKIAKKKPIDAINNK